MRGLIASVLYSGGPESCLVAVAGRRRVCRTLLFKNAAVAGFVGRPLENLVASLQVARNRHNARIGCEFFYVYPFGFTVVP